MSSGLSAIQLEQEYTCAVNSVSVLLCFDSSWSSHRTQLFALFVAHSLRKGGSKKIKREMRDSTVGKV